MKNEHSDIDIIAVAAEYREQELDDYKNNPMIESLPPILSRWEVFENCNYMPKHSEEEKNIRQEVRVHILRRLKQFTVPFIKYVEVESKLSCILRAGYLARNPFLKKEFRTRFQALRKIPVNSPESTKAFKQSEIKTTAACFCILGISGIGKTTLINRLLTMYPQVIKHSLYKGEPLITTQVVWLKTDAPHDGSLKTLCNHIFLELDKLLLGERYFEKHGNSRNSVSKMLGIVTQLATVLNLGVLVIDEVQHLANRKGEALEEVSNFFTNLVNIGIPLILIGTPKAGPIFSEDFKKGRRGTEDGAVVWDRMAKDAEWELFLEAMWDLQWLREKAELSDELREVMYHESQGITAIAVNLFRLAQEKALLRNLEKLTPDLIRSVSQYELKPIQPMINALRSGDVSRISKIEDISTEGLWDIDAKLSDREKIQLLAEQQKFKRDTLRMNIKDKVYQQIISLNIFPNLTSQQLTDVIEGTVKSIPNGWLSDECLIKQQVIKAAQEENDRIGIWKEERKKAKQKKVSFEKGDLREIYYRAQKEKLPVTSLLTQAGYLKNPVVEFL